MQGQHSKGRDVPSGEKVQIPDITFPVLLRLRKVTFRSIEQIGALLRVVLASPELHPRVHRDP